MLTTQSEDRRRGPLERFEKRVLAGFAVAALTQIVFGTYRARIAHTSAADAAIAAVAILLLGALWFARSRRLPGGVLGLPAGLLLATAGLYSGYTALNVPFLGIVARFSLPLLFLLAGALLLFAEQEWEFQAVPFVLAAVAFVVVQIVLTREVSAGAAPVATGHAVSSEEGGILGELEGVQIARSFVDAINAHDPAAIAARATSDHRFIDALGQTVPREQLEPTWAGYFRTVPDYRIEVERWVPDEESVLAYGTMSGTYTADGTLHPENRWSTPAAWRARIRDGQVAEWQVYSDGEPLRLLMSGRRSNVPEKGN